MQGVSSSHTCEAPTESGSSCMSMPMPSLRNWEMTSSNIWWVEAKPDWELSLKFMESPASMPSPHWLSLVPGFSQVEVPSGTIFQPWSSRSFWAAAGSNWYAQPSIVPTFSGDMGTGPQVGEAVPFQTLSDRVFWSMSCCMAWRMYFWLMNFEPEAWGAKFSAR